MLETIFSWTTLWWILMPIYVFACLGLILIVLMQKGKGSGFAGAFGVGPGSETVFGPRARKSLPVKLTYIAATLFMVLSLCLSLIVGRESRGAAPDVVAEDSVSVSQDKALDAIFGEGSEPTTAPAATGGEPTVSAAPAAPASATPEAAAPEAPAAPSGQ